jgi:hypothetical protein
MSKAGDALGGGLSGAATGATIGSVVPGVGTAIGAGVGGLIGGVSGYLGGGEDPEEKRRRQRLLGQSLESAGEADETYNSYKAYGQQGQGALDYLRGQTQGQNSVSAEQLRQGLQQLYGQQRSMAAGASPRNAAMAARTAAIQSANLGQGMAGQQAIAGLQERNAANAAYGNLLQGLRGQDLNATLQTRQMAMSGYGAQNAAPQQPSWIQQYGPAITGALGAYAQIKKPPAVGAAPSSAPGATDWAM